MLDITHRKTNNKFETYEITYYFQINKSCDKS